MTGSNNSDTPIRRLAKCPHGESCEVAERQALLTDDLKDFRKDFYELKCSMQEVVKVFEDSKTVVGFLGRAGRFIRLTALTITALAALWAAITHWPKQ